ncbi:MAG: shikimate dehydrogenase [Liquorilactobacillus ghanensis]|uniref:shikimate dehydrogenase n=1 Tax=Liquorilactobacillus ghanensis TaxID=399370 RepID=UPI0039E92593
MNGETRLYGFLAHPAQHSLSPLMHNLSFQFNHLNACYLAFDVLPADFANAVNGLRALNFGGANLSLPYKQQALKYLNELTPRAQKIAAVNTIRNDNGRLIGDSTDGAGLFTDLQEQKILLTAQTIMILGAGGAGRAIIAAAADYHIKRVYVCKRPNQTYTKIAAWLQQLAAQTATEYCLVNYADTVALLTALQKSAIVINATDQGMDNQQLPLPLEVLQHLKPQQFVYDLIYHPLVTPFLKYAQQRGCNSCNGIGMLLWQGALAFEFWTGKKMPIEIVRKNLVTEIRRRTK